MDTPIVGFVKEYSDSDAVRMHMPGHKGRKLLGPEPLDITEISGADVLYHPDVPDGIIQRSQENASRIFGTAKTLYSTEGSSLCIRAMLYLIKMYHTAHCGGNKAGTGCKSSGRPLIAAGRNAHKTFITAAALLDIDIEWIYPDDCRAGDIVPGEGKGSPLTGKSLVSCSISAEHIRKVINSSHPLAVYITSPDYLGNIADIRGIAEVCHSCGCLLIVDNAHGAYLKFMRSGSGKETAVSMHPIDNGADMCCDSAHKTLPALTGAAYLHISESAPAFLCEYAEHAMQMFASTSPSYLIMQSLDAVNGLLAGDFRERLERAAAGTERLKAALRQNGYKLAGDEALKVTICAKSYGYRGTELAKLLEMQNIFSEFSDPDYLVLMISSETDAVDLERTAEALNAIPVRPEITEQAPVPGPGIKVMEPGEAMLAEKENLSPEEASGRVMAAVGASCPPAIPIAVCGELIDDNAAACFRYYGIEKVPVVKRQHYTAAGQ